MRRIRDEDRRFAEIVKLFRDLLEPKDLTASLWISFSMELPSVSGRLPRYSSMISAVLRTDAARFVCLIAIVITE